MRRSPAREYSAGGKGGIESKVGRNDFKIIAPSLRHFIRVGKMVQCHSFFSTDSAPYETGSCQRNSEILR